MTRYEEDEFDLAARERGPRGVHRPVQPRWKRLLPYIVALILAPILAFAAISLLNRDAGTEDPAAAPTPAVTEAAADPTATVAPAEPAEPSEAAAPAEPTEETPTPDIRYDTTVVVLNGVGVPGIAGRGAERLAAAGFTSTQADNYTSAVPENSTVYYASPDLADTAAAVGQTLGITAIVEDAEATSAIAVVLRGDYQE